MYEDTTDEFLEEAPEDSSLHDPTDTGDAPSAEALGEDSPGVVWDRGPNGKLVKTTEE